MLKSAEKTQMTEKPLIFASAIRKELRRISHFTSDYAFSENITNAIDSADGGDRQPLEEWVGTTLVASSSSPLHLVAIWGPSGKLLLKLHSTNNSAFPVEVPAEISDPSFTSRLASNSTCGVFSFNDTVPLIGCFQSVHWSTETPAVRGFLLFAKAMRSTLPYVSGVIKSCISVAKVTSPDLTKRQRAAISELESTVPTNVSKWGEVFVTMPYDGRSEICPAGVVESTKEASLFWLVRDPVNGHGVGPLIRISHSLSTLSSGRRVVTAMSPAIIAALILVGVLLWLFVDIGVLGRLRKVTEQLKTNMEEARADSPATADEVSKLELLLRYRIKLLVKEFDDASAEREDEAVQLERLNDAAELLNVLCRRETHFPDGELLFSPETSGGPVQPTTPTTSATTTATETAAKLVTTVDICGTMENPFALEFLKDHLRATEGDVGPVLFVIEVMMLMEEQSAEKKLRKATSLYQRFLSTSTAKYKLRLRYKKTRWVKDAIKAKADAAATALFQSIADEVIERLCHHSLPMLQQSEVYPHVLAVLRAERGCAVSGPHVEVREVVSIANEASQFLVDYDAAVCEDVDDEEPSNPKSRANSIKTMSSQSRPRKPTFMGSPRVNRKLFRKSERSSFSLGSTIELDTISSSKDGDVDAAGDGDDHFVLEAAAPSLP